MIAWLTAIFILDMLNIMSAWDDARSLRVSIVFCHAVLRVENSIDICGSWFGESILLMEELYDSGSVQAVTSSVQLLCTMVLLLSSSSSLYILLY